MTRIQVRTAIVDSHRQTRPLTDAGIAATTVTNGNRISRYRLCRNDFQNNWSCHNFWKFSNPAYVIGPKPDQLVIDNWKLCRYAATTNVQ